MSRFKQSEAMRQKVLDYVNANPGIDAPAIIKHLGCLKNTGSSLLKRMADGDEVRREEIVMEGTCSAFQTYQYWANVTKPLGLKQVRANIDRKLKSGELKFDSYANSRKPPVEYGKWVNGCYKNTSDRMPNRSIDNMGSSGIGFGIQSSFQMI
jgi:hypothetical protein